MDAAIFRKVTSQEMMFKTCCAALMALGTVCHADTVSTVPVSAQPQLEWVNGPTTVTLANVADFKVPEGYRFLDAKGARNLLERQKHTAPPALVGLLQPESQSGMILLEFANIGYMELPSSGKINGDAILADVRDKMERENISRKRLGYAPMTAVNWDSPPTIDSDALTLECTYRIEIGSNAMVNHSIRKFGRHGIIVATTQSTAEPLKSIMGGVTFKKGQRYQDYTPGDTLASLDISQLLTGAEFPTIAQHRMSRATLIWIVSSLGVCVLGVVGFLVSREIRTLKAQHSFDAHPNRNRITGRPYVNGYNRERNGAAHKRAFDYQRFYADMMMQVSGRATVRPRRVEAEDRNGKAQQAVEAQTAAELIAQQKVFIEEQRRLMQQQAKLIEERSRLIEEKNQLLAKQTEMIESQLL